MKVAIIGGGISGLTVAHYLQGKASYTLFEKETKLGGHSDTHNVVIEDKEYKVDTGFIVFNKPNYKEFNRLLEIYKVEKQKSNMSFSVSNRQTGLEYNATSLTGLFCQFKNILDISFYRMIFDIIRFYKRAPKLLKQIDNQITLNDYLSQSRYGQYFIEEHIIPMASALWSGDFESIKQFPLKYLLSFMNNHNMLQINKRPQWYTIKGGSQQYVQAISKGLTGRINVNTEVMMIERYPDKVTVHSSSGRHDFDYVIFACHSDQALSLLRNPCAQEIEVLQSIPYTKNEVTLHTDGSVMPKNKKAWASWSVIKHRNPAKKCTVNYYMNLLQGINCPQPIIVSLNQNERINRDKVLKTIYYQHPVYTPETIKAQNRKPEIQGVNRSYFCGAYWGWGFHEDGVKSAISAVQNLLKGSFCAT